MHRIAKRAKVPLAEIPESGDPEEWLSWAEEASEKAGPEVVAGVIKDSYSGARVRDVRLPEIYKDLVSLRVKLFATTNYDPFIQRALADNERLLSPRVVDVARDAAEFGRLNDESEIAIVHLHGSAQHPETCVLTRSSYAAIAEKEAYRIGVMGWLSNKRLLFVGYSLRDPDMRAFLDSWRSMFSASGAATKHWILGDQFAPEHVRELRRLGVEPIPYRDHANLPHVLRYLAQVDCTSGATSRRVMPGDAHPELSLPAEIIRKLDAMEFEAAASAARDRMVELGPTPSMLYVRAWALWASDDPDAAFQSLEEVRDIVYQNGSLLLLYAALATAVDDRVAARSAFRHLRDNQARFAGIDVREISFEEYAERLSLALHQRGIAALRATDLLRVGQLPWLALADLLGHPYFVEWSRRSAERHFEDDPATRLWSTIYASHGGLCRDGKFVESELPPPGGDCVVDESALFSLYRLGLLDQARKYFGTIFVPPQASEGLGGDQTQLAVEQRGVRSLLTASIANRSLSTGRSVQLADLADHLCDGDAGLIALLSLKSCGSSPAPVPRHTAIELPLTEILDAAGLGLAPVLESRFQVSVRAEDVVATRDLLQRLESGTELRADHDAFRRCIRERVTCAPISQSRSPVDRSHAAASLALERGLPLVADDRSIAALVHGRSEGRLAAFGSAVFIDGLVREDWIDRGTALEHFLQLIRWGYRFLSPPSWLWSTVFRIEGESFPGERSITIARYVHDCVRDPGLLHGQEATDPPTSQSFAFLSAWTRSMRESLDESWRLGEAASEVLQRRTRRLLRELVPAAAWFAHDHRERPIATSIRDLTMAGTLLAQIQIPDREAARLYVRTARDALGFSEEEFTKVVVDTCRQIGEPVELDGVAFDLRKYVVDAAYPAGSHTSGSTLARLRALGMTGACIKWRMDGEVVDPILDVQHPMREDSGKLPHLVIAAEREPGRRAVVVGPVEDLLYDDSASIRIAALDQLERIHREDSSTLLPETARTLAIRRSAVSASDEATWSKAVVEVDQALRVDWMWHLECARDACSLGNQGAIDSRLEPLFLPSIATVEGLSRGRSAARPSSPSSAVESRKRRSAVASLLEILAKLDEQVIVPLDGSTWHALDVLRECCDTRPLASRAWKQVASWMQSSVPSRARVGTLLGVRVPRLIPRKQRRTFVAQLIEQVRPLADRDFEAASTSGCECLIAEHLFHHLISQDPTGNSHQCASTAWWMATRCVAVPSLVRVFERSREDFVATVAERSRYTAVGGRSPVSGSVLAQVTSGDPQAAWPLTMLVAIADQPECLTWMDADQIEVVRAAVFRGSNLVPDLAACSPRGRTWADLHHWVLRQPAMRKVLNEEERAQELALLVDEANKRKLLERSLAVAKHSTAPDPQHLSALHRLVVMASTDGSTVSETRVDFDDVWGFLPADPLELGRRLSSLDLPNFGTWVGLVGAIPRQAERPGRIPHYLAHLAECEGLSAAQQDLVFSAVALACLRDGSHRALSRLRHQMPELWNRAGRQVRTALDSWLDYAPPWLSARMRAVCAELPTEGLSADEQAALRRRTERTFASRGRVHESASHDVPTINDLDSRFRAGWQVSYEAWMLSRRAFPDYSRGEAPGAVWRNGQSPPEHAA
ncbi:MAG: SIR2 family protein [Planctomycetota bacterium]